MAGPGGLALYWLIRSVVMIIKRRKRQAAEAVL